MIRIISGQFRNFKLKIPTGDKTRPTTSQLRACVFNICQQEVEGANFLDICAGSGSMGLEAISRGAVSATFIEQDRFAVKTLSENIQTLHVERQTKIYPTDALLALKKLAGPFQLCYFDPPYTKDERRNPFVEAVLLFLDSHDLIAKDGRIFLEESSHFQLEEIVLKNISLESKRRFGSSFLYCFRKG